MRRTFVITLLSSIVTVSCGADFPEPQTIDHPERAFVEVPYMPPAALVEVAGEAPNDACVWFDGHWVWHGSKYLWRRGGWVTSHPNRYYAKWKTVILDDGRLLFAGGAWYDAAGQRVEAPRILRPARTPSNEVTSEFGAPR